MQDVISGAETNLLGSELPQHGSKVFVTILFADVIGSTRRIGGLQLEDVNALIGRAVARMRRHIHDYQGTLARVQGDGVMAIFGAPLPMEDHALRACFAAHAMCEEFRALSRSPAGQTEMSAIRVGIHSGVVLTDIRTNDFGRDYDAVGEPVHFAAKVEGKAAPNMVLTTATTLRLAGPTVAAKPAGLLDLHNGEHLELFEIESLTLHETVDHVAARRHLSPLVGRHDLMTHLAGKLNNIVREGRGLTVAVTAAMGLGRSRIAYELARDARARRVRVEVLQCISAQKRTPFAPVRSLMLSLLGCSGRTAPAELFDAVQSTGLTHHRREGLLELVGLPPRDSGWSDMEGTARRQAMLDAASELVEKAIQARPLLIVADDAHHLDLESADFLTSLSVQCKTSPLALVLTARNEHRAFIERLSDEKIELMPLAGADAQELCTSLIAGVTFPATTIAAAIERASGNPLILHEIVRELLNSDGTGAPSTPLSVANLVSARMEGVGASARQVGQAVGILGDSVDRKILRATADVGEAALIDALAELDRQGLLDVANPAVVRFRHEVFREAVVETLLRPRRVELHLSAVRAYETVFPRDAGTLERLAVHSEAAGEIDLALSYILDAVRLAVRSWSLKTVRELYAWAMRLKPSAAAASRDVLVAIAAQSFDALQQSGDAVEYRNALEFVALQSNAAGNRELESLACGHLALLDWMQSKLVLGRQNAERALKLAKELGSLRLRTIAQPHLAMIEHAQGNLDSSIDLHLDIVAALEAGHDSSTLGRMILPGVRSRAFAAWLMTERGRFDDAERQIEKGEAVLRLVAQPYSRVLINAARGILALRRGRPADAIAPLEEARHLCLKQHFYVMEPCVSGWLASALVQVGEAERARAIASHSIETGLYRHGGRYTWVYIHQGLAEAQFACGEVGAALATIDKAVAIAEESKEPIHIAQARAARGHIRIATGDVALGAADLSASLALATKHHADPLATECRRALDRLQI
ncbi:MAG: AAA family ATPase [Alphaproteobacteria bacterium]|nr:AAA family ATPase [Alphaproteobacteria bacterium]